MWLATLPYSFSPVFIHPKLSSPPHSFSHHLPDPLFLFCFSLITNFSAHLIRLCILLLIHFPLISSFHLTHFPFSLSRTFYLGLFTVFCSGLCISLCRYHSISFQSNINIGHENIVIIIWRLVACITSTTKPPVLDKVQSSFGRRQCQVLEGQPLQVLLVHDYWLLVMTMGTDEPSTFLTKLHLLF